MPQKIIRKWEANAIKICEEKISWYSMRSAMRARIVINITGEIVDLDRALADNYILRKEKIERRIYERSIKRGSK